MSESWSWDQSCSYCDSPPLSRGDRGASTAARALPRVGSLTVEPCFDSGLVFFPLFFNFFSPALHCTDLTQIRTFERVVRVCGTDPGPYPDSAPGPLRPWRGSPWTTPAPSPPSPGASSSCWSRSVLPRKKRGLSSSELRQIASSHSFLSNPPEGGREGRGEKPTHSVRPTQRSKTIKNAHVSVYSGAQTHQVSKVNPNCD